MHIALSPPENAAALTRIAFAAKRSWGYPQEWIERWRPVLTVTPDYIRANMTFSATEGDEIFGFCALRLNGTDAWVDHLWVSPESAGKGIGRALFFCCEQTAGEHGAVVLRIESDPNAEGFYHAMGAVTVGRVPAPMDGSERFLPLLEKTLG
jgi:GNAT superfamily N-acetyltransferase